MQVKTKCYNAASIISVRDNQPLDGGLPFCRYIFSPKSFKNSDFGGAGLYACFYRKNLIYIGKYQGVKDNFSFGDIVAMRWVKHLGTFTMKAKNLGFSKVALANVMEAVTGLTKADLKIPQQIIDSFIAANRQVLQRETGCMTTYQRFLVAINVWRDVKDPAGIPELGDFDFIYSRIAGQITTELAREIVSSAENYVLERIHPPGNSIANRSFTLLPNPWQIEEFFEEALASITTYDTIKIQGLKNTLNAAQKVTGNLESEEITTSFGVAIEDSPAFARQFVERVQAYFIDVEGADIEFTNTPDMRVRKIYPQIKRGFRNCVRFEWQSSKKRFLMYTKLSDHQLNTFGLHLDRSSHSDVLPSVTFLYEETIRENMKFILSAMSHAFLIFEP